MSRVGRKPITVPSGVQVVIKDKSVTVKGAKAELKAVIPDGITVKLQEGTVLVERSGETREQRSCHGLMRARLANMLKGVTDGFTRQLEINGVGYRAEITGNKLNLSVGLSHPVDFEIPKGVQAKSEKSKSTVNSGQDAVLLTLTGPDNEIVGQFASQIRNVRQPEPYKGKGIKYLEEKIQRKAGKAAGK